jgi:hypothetical protein
VEAQLYRRHGGAERRGDRRERQALAAELEDLALRGRQRRHRDTQRTLGARGGQLVVRRRGARRALRAIRVLAVIDEALLLPPAPDRVDDQPTRDRIGPRQERRTGGEGAPRAVDVEERLLDDILRERALAERAHREREDARRDGVVDRGERAVIAARVALHRRIRGELVGVGAIGSI